MGALGAICSGRVKMGIFPDAIFLYVRNLDPLRPDINSDLKRMMYPIITALFSRFVSHFFQVSRFCLFVPSLIPNQQSMVQTISESMEGSAPVEPDSSDAAAGGGGSGDAGGGGRDDARVVELTKLLCTVHDMSSQVYGSMLPTGMACGTPYVCVFFVFTATARC